MKKIINAMLIFCMMLSITGCSDTEKDFISTLYGKTYESYSSTGTMEIKLTSSVPNEIKEQIKPFNIQSLLNALSDFKLAWGETAYIKDDSINTKASLGISTPSASFVTNCCVYTENGDMVTVFDLPSVLKAFLPEEYENASKAYFKLSELNETGDNLYAVKYPELIKSATELNKDFQKFILDYSVYIPEITGLVKKSGSTYTVTISDEQLKSIIDSALSVYFKNENARKTANEFIIKFFNIYKTMYTEEMYNETFGAIENQLNSLTTEDLLNAYEEFNGIKEKIKNIKLLGKNGIQISYTFQSGYIKKASGTIDFIIDISNISKEINGTDFSSDFNIEGVIKYSQDVTDVNRLKKADVINFDLKDAVSITDWLNAYNKSNSYDEYENYNPYSSENYIANVTLPASDGSITVFDDCGYKIDLMGLTAKNINGTLYVPLEPVLNSGYYSYYWDNNAKEMVVSNYNNNYFIKPNSNIIYTDSYKLVLNFDVINIDGFLYIPLRSFADAFLDEKVYWNGDLNFAFIGSESYCNYLMKEEY